MAKYTPGPITGVLSGAAGNVVFTRNRGGCVMRIRAVPVFAQSDYRDAVHTLMSGSTLGWRGLTDAERTAWSSWAVEHPRVDSLGHRHVLQGSAAYVSVNMRATESGGAEIRVPSLDPLPDPLAGLTVAATSGPSSVVLNWTSGDVGAVEVVHAWVAVLSSAGKSYYKNLLKLVAISDAAESTDWDIGSYVETRFGALTAGQIVKVHAYVVSRTSGYRSSVATATATVDA